MPCCCAISPSKATEVPLPLATASDSRRSENNAQALACVFDGNRITLPTGIPASARLGVTHSLIIASAVSKASLPIRKTQTLRLRKTPVASANTFGRPSNTKPTTPSGAM